MLFAVLPGSLAHNFSELAGKVVAVGKAAVEGDVGDGPLRAVQQHGGFSDADMHEVINGGAANAVVKNSLEMARGEMRFAGEILQCYFFCIAGFDVGEGIAEAEQIE